MQTAGVATTSWQERLSPELFGLRAGAIWIASLVLFSVTGGALLRAAEPVEAVLTEEKPRVPNIVLFFADDLGYADLGCFGGAAGVTPNLDRMASEGIRFTDFHVSQAVCSASRSSLLTGCYSNRVSIQGALGPGSKTGLALSEDTIAELLKRSGYATAIYGKWHLGDDPGLLPAAQGFDDYFGLPYSNDMWPFHPTAKNFPELPLIDGTDVKIKAVTPEDQKNLTRWYTEHAVDFIDKHADSPFFVYVPHSMPHVPIYASKDFEGKTGKGLHADVIAEIDWSVGTILKKLSDEGLDDNTLVIFTSDNGPWLSYGPHAGSAGPLREGKGTSWEGGTRVPFVARWPGKIPAGKTCDALTGTIDLLPTLVQLVGGQLPERKIDGKDIGDLLFAKKMDWDEPRTYYYYWIGELQAVRQGDWKLHFPHTYRTVAGEVKEPGQPAPYREEKIELALYNLAEDLGEKENVASKNPEMVRKLELQAEVMRNELGDSLTGKMPAAARAAAMVKKKKD